MCVFLHLWFNTGIFAWLYTRIRVVRAVYFTFGVRVYINDLLAANSWLVPAS
jgi:hypothetical protein